MASPEGVTILSASVMEDVVGITLLAVVLGIDALGDAASGAALWREIIGIGGRALLVWLGFTTLGIVFSRRISALLKVVKSPAQIAVLSLGLALILAGLFEAAGLAMIIGAYVMGLSLADTDIAYVVQDKIETVHRATSKPVDLRRNLVESASRAMVDWYRYLPVECVHLSMRATDKTTIIGELVSSLVAAGRVRDREAVLDAVLERERSMSTGMQHGVAIPHGRSDAVDTLSVAVGIVPEGIDFESIDGEPATIVFLVVSPKENPGPHLQVLAGIAGIVNSDEARRDLVSSPTRADLLAYLVEHSSAKA